VCWSQYASREREACVGLVAVAFNAPPYDECAKPMTPVGARATFPMPLVHNHIGRRFMPLQASDFENPLTGATSESLFCRTIKFRILNGVNGPTNS
jgi:hypothetical protein